MKALFTSILFSLSLICICASAGDDYQLLGPIEEAQQRVAVVSSVGMLRGRPTQVELELTEVQIGELNAILNSMGKEIRESVDMSQQGSPPPPGFGTWKKHFDSIVKRYETKAYAKLLPFQKRRLFELGVQHRLKLGGVVGILTSRELAGALQITPEQLQGIHEKAHPTIVELEESILKAKLKALRELTSDLSPSQQAKLKKLLGDVNSENLRFEPSSKLTRPNGRN